MTDSDTPITLSVKRIRGEALWDPSQKRLYENN